MLADRYRRLLQRRLRRRPLLAFLLAATVAVDAAILATTLEAGVLRGLVAGFITAQIGLLAIWLAAGRRLFFPRLVACFAGIALLAWLVLHTTEDSSTIDNAPGDVVAVVVALFAVDLIGASVVALAARRWSPTVGRRSRGRFSIGHLLGATLATALLAVAVRLGDWRYVFVGSVIWRIAGHMAPTVVMLVFARVSPAGWRRAVLLVGVPLLCVVLQLRMNQFTGDLKGLDYLAKAFVLGVWMWAISLSCNTERATRPTASPAPSSETSDDGGPATILMRIDAIV